MSDGTTITLRTVERHEWVQVEHGVENVGMLVCNAEGTMLTATMTPKQAEQTAKALLSHAALCAAGL